MSWHYAARKRESLFEFDVFEFDVAEEVYELVEVYNFDGIMAHSQDAVTVEADSRENLAKWLRQAADDVMKYDVIDETGEEE